ncbi:MAG: hypothetical protein ACE5FT_06895 [Candidatus Nanoarchaeia archaeon]
MDINDLVENKEFEKPKSNEGMPHVLAQYAARSGDLSAVELRQLCHGDPKLFFKSFVEFLKRKNPDRLDIVEGILNIKSHGLGFTIPQKIIDEGLIHFPEGYLELGDLSKHDKLSLTVVHHAKSFPIKTFPSKTYAEMVDYFKQKGCKLIPVAMRTDNYVKKIHKSIDVNEKILKRATQPAWMQRIDNIEYPLTKDIFNYVLETPSVLFRAFEDRSRVTVAIPGTWSNMCDDERGYINSTAVAAKALAERGKKITILDLDTSFGGGTVKLLLGEQNITLIGLQTDPETDPGLNIRDHTESEQNSYQFNIPIGLNGKGYLDILNQAIQKIPTDTGVLIVSVGLDNYVFDSLGLQCVEQKYFKTMGELIHKSTTHIPKIILQPGGGFEDIAPQLFAEMCNAVGGK